MQTGEGVEEAEAEAGGEGPKVGWEEAGGAGEGGVREGEDGRRIEMN